MSENTKIALSAPLTRTASVRGETACFKSSALSQLLNISDWRAKVLHNAEFPAPPVPTNIIIWAKTIVVGMNSMWLVVNNGGQIGMNSDCKMGAARNKSVLLFFVFSQEPG
jgi:hypothetical protein